MTSWRSRGHGGGGDRRWTGEGGRASGGLVGRPIGLARTQQQYQLLL